MFTIRPKKASARQEKHQASLDRLKDQTYNNRGISGAGFSSNSNEDYYHTGFDKLTNQTELENSKLRQQHEQELLRLKNGYENDLIKKDKEARDAVNSVRNTAVESLAQERSSNNEAMESLKNQYYNSKGKLSASVPYDVYRKDLQDQETMFNRRHELD